jgi:hypothetical protein
LHRGPQPTQPEAAEFGMTPCARAKMRAGYDDGGGGPSKFTGLLG